MKDPIIAAYLADFVDHFGFADLDDGSAFEYFTNYCLLSKHDPEPFDLEEVAIGGGGDLGIDGVGVIVNDHLVLSPDSVDYLKRHLRRLDVTFVFIQAKTSPQFEAAPIGAFISGVRQFFAPDLPKDANAKVRALHQLKRHIFASSIDMDTSPVCRLYYVTTGVWNDNAALRTIIDQGIRDLKTTNLFSSVEFIPIDSEALKRIHRELNHQIVREIYFDKHTTLPPMQGVQESYIGVVPCPEYLKLLLR